MSVKERKSRIIFRLMAWKLGNNVVIKRHSKHWEKSKEEIREPNDSFHFRHAGSENPRGCLIEDIKYAVGTTGLKVRSSDLDEDFLKYW